MSISLSFLAGLLLKVHEGKSFTAEDVVVLQTAVGSVASVASPVEPTKPETTNTSPQPPVEVEKMPAAPEAPEAPVEYQAPKKIKKVKCVEDSATSNTSIPLTIEISARHCLARMVQKKNVLPGTDDNKVYEVKQCIRLRAKGELLCPKCEEYYTAFKEKSKGKANWEGFINEVPLDHLHVVGSKWFREHWPTGLPTTAIPNSTTTTTIDSSNAVETTAPIVIPSDPAKETVLAENVPVKEVKWINIKISGIHYIYNARDRRIYRANISSEGEDQIMWDNFEGKYISGQIDPYAEETEEEPDA